jgi:hypothetical protein
MVEKLDQFEILKEVSLLIDSLEPSERRQVMASLAERNGMKLVEKPAAGGSGYRPAPRRGKAKAW